jgi:hypothetical protein
VAGTTITNNPNYSNKSLDWWRSSTSADLKPAAVRAIYTNVAIENRYTVRGIRVQVPLARAGTASSIPTNVNAVNSDNEPAAITQPEALNALLASTQFDTCVIANIGPAQATREIIYDATRVGAWPAIPRPLETIQFGNIRGYLIHSEYAFQPPANTPDASSKTAHLRARYVYALSRPPLESEKLNINSQPFQADYSEQVGIVLQTLYDESMSSGTPTTTPAPQTS